MDLEVLTRLATPSFERQMRIVARLQHQDPELYATIQMGNPFTDEALEILLGCARRLRALIEARDRRGFIELFQEVQALGPAFDRIEQGD